MSRHAAPAQLPGAVMHVGPLTGTAIAGIAMFLPAESRVRYTHEFRAELVTLPAHRRPGPVISLLTGAPALRHALKETQMSAPSLSTDHHLRCRIGLHHWVRFQNDNPEDRASSHRECASCGRIRDDVDRRGIGYGYGPFV